MQKRKQMTVGTEHDILLKQQGGGGIRDYHKFQEHWCPNITLFLCNIWREGRKEGKEHGSEIDLPSKN